MARWIGLLGVVGGLVLFAVQNSSPYLPLVFLGMTTQTLPLSVWLVGAVALGAMTTLLLVGLLNLTAGTQRTRKNPFRRSRHPVSSGGRDAGRRSQDQAAGPSHRASGTSSTRGGAATEPSQLNLEDWEQFRSPSTWDDWGQPTVPGSSSSSSTPPKRGFWSRQARAEEERQVVESSVEEISHGWDEMGQRSYVARGGSEVEDSLDEIVEGWDDYTEADYIETDYRQTSGPAPRPPRIYEVDQTPTHTQQSGSVYSYRYREDGGDGEAAYNASDYKDGYGDAYGQEDYGIDDYPEELRRGDGEDEPEPVGSEEVYDADYRVIIPPYRNLDDDQEGTDRR